MPVSTPILGWEDQHERRFGKKRLRTGGVVRMQSLKAAKVLLGVGLCFVALFFYLYEVHVEIQLFSRGWIHKAILKTPPLSSTCFSPSTIASSEYNVTLARAPSFVELHAGIRMPFGTDCYDFASTLPDHPTAEMVLPSHTLFHTYWRSDLLPIGQRHVALFESILATQDRDTTSVILWTNSEGTLRLKEHPRLQPLFDMYGTRFSVRSINKKQLASGTPIEGSRLLNMSDKKAWLDGDLVRILVLWGRGGIWVDMDTIMTGRDLRVLGEGEWVTQWDCYDKIYAPLNGAMMHFYRNSPYLCEMMFAMANDPPPRQGSTDWGSLLYHKIWRRLVSNGIKPFKVLPYCFSDGRSCRLDNRLPDPFAKEPGWSQSYQEALEKKIRSAFAVHLHNQWDKNFPKSGWVQKLILSKVTAAGEAYSISGSSTINGYPQE